MEFEIRNRLIKVSEKQLTIGDNADYIAHFKFDEEWHGVEKTARFIHNGSYVDVLLNNDQCSIPVEVLKCGYVSVGVYSEKMTTSQTDFVVIESIKEKGGNAAEPTPSVYEQLTGKLDDIKEQLPNEVESYFNEHKAELKGDKGDKGERGEQGIQGVQGVQGEKGVVDYTLVANALVGKASGEIVRVDDVSPVEHTAKVKVKSKNIFNINNLITTSGASDNSHITEVGNDYIIISTPETHTLTSYTSTRKTLKELCPSIEVGKTYTLTANTDSENNKLMYITQVKVSWYFGKSVKITEEMLDQVVIFYGFDITGGESAGDCKISNIQIEEGDTATKYTPYIDPISVKVTRYEADETTAETYTANADGTLAIPSIAPTMTLLTDKDGVNIELEYNKDLNAVINGILAKLS